LVRNPASAESPDRNVNHQNGARKPDHRSHDRSSDQKAGPGLDQSLGRNLVQNPDSSPRSLNLDRSPALRRRARNSLAVRAANPGSRNVRKERTSPANECCLSPTFSIDHCH
jgi:hypothetical protein